LVEHPPIVRASNTYVIILACAVRETFNVEIVIKRL